MSARRNPDTVRSCLLQTGSPRFFYVCILAVLYEKLWLRLNHFSEVPQNDESNERDCQNLTRRNAMLLEKLTSLECTLHGAKRNDRKWLEQILHPEFTEITRSGLRVNRQETIDSLTAEEGAPAILSSDFRLISIRDDFAILHYRTIHPEGTRASLRTSCWECSDNRHWRLVFHQGTPEAGSLG